MDNDSYFFFNEYYFLTKKPLIFIAFTKIVHDVYSMFKLK